MEATTEWVEEFERQADKLLAVVALDDFWANVEPKIALEFAWNRFASAIISLPVLRRDLWFYAKDASCWDGIKRRWMPVWMQRRWPPLVEVYDIDEITSPDGEQTRYVLRVEMMTQEEWLSRLRELMTKQEAQANPGGTTNDADDWRAVKVADE